MPNVAYIFPGQGAQYVGMGEDFCRAYPPAKAIFEQADSVLGFALTKLIFKGPIEELTRTENCQLAIFTVSMAYLAALERESPGISPRYTAGLSLGEYTALAAAGALSFAEALKLVRVRAQAMEEAAQLNPGGMVSLIELPLEAVEEICAQTSAEVANLNCPGQVVISGSLAALEKAKDLALARGAKLAIPLKVGGAFHSSLMASASRKLTQALKEAKIFPPRIPVISNVTAKAEKSTEEIKENLARQLVTRTRWEDSVKFIQAQGLKVFVEIGPGKVLAGLLGKINPQLKVYNIGTLEELKGFPALVKGW